MKEMRKMAVVVTAADVQDKSFLVQGGLEWF